MQRIVLPFALMLIFSSPSYLSAQEEGRSIPCRIRDYENSDLLMMTLGDVTTPVAQGMFYPEKDLVKLKDGTVLDHYYRDTLRIPFYKPIDKSVFPVPPSGWCSWYYYFYEISEEEIKSNAKWCADNLKDYGLEYIQIDDGWQGVGRGFGTNRDWTTINNRFPGGMENLASFIKQLGMKPALWIAPHGQSNPKVVNANKAAFLLKPDGTTLSDTWEGTFLVDPSTEEGHAHLKNLFTTLSKWGYEYFKIDGQPCVVDEYRRCAAQMKHPSKDPVESYRSTLRTIRQAIGDKRYLLGCWEIPLEGVGLTDGWRTGADVVPGWGGFLIAMDATMGYYFLHNIVWYCDADTVMAHHPLTIDQSRVWATLQGLTGQALMCSDRMMDLSCERVELYKRIYPAVDIRPLDLFPSPTRKSVWDLKVSHLGRKYDVVGLFNYDEKSNKSIYLNWRELGISGDQAVHVYDFWNKEYLGVYPKGFSTEVGPTNCRVLTLAPATPEIQLLSTSRHITQGWLDLLGVAHDAAKNTFQGKSRVIKDDPYTLTFAFPPGTTFAVTEATAGGLPGDELPVKISNHQGWATVTILPKETKEVSWKVSFAPSQWYRFPCANPGAVRAVVSGLDSVTVKWDQPGVSSVGAFLVSLNSELLGATKGQSFPLGTLSYGKTYSVQVSSIWDDGTTSATPAASVTFTLDSLLRKVHALTDLDPVRPARGSRSERIGIDESAAGKPLSLGGKRFATGLGAKASVVLEYDLHGLFEEFTAMAGIDDSSPSGGVVLLVEGDGRELWNSGEVRKGDGAKPVAISVRGVKRLVLRTTGSDAKNSGVLVDWCEGAIRRK